MIDWFIGGATKYKKLVVNNRDISQLVGTVTWSGDSKQVARKLVFTVAARASDRFLPKVPIREGDQVVFSYKDKSAPEKVLFGGPVLDIDKAASGNSITYTALGSPLHGDIAKSELKRFIVEALMVNPYIEELGNFQISQTGSGVRAEFDCTTIYGPDKISGEFKGVKL